jgi:hypothetical protein
MRLKNALRSQDFNSSSSSRSVNSSASSSLHVYTWEPLYKMLGWATFPQSYETSPSQDGVVIMHSAITGGDFTNFSLGHTLTHEVGFDNC